MSNLPDAEDPQSLILDSNDQGSLSGEESNVAQAKASMRAPGETGSIKVSR